MQTRTLLGVVIAASGCLRPADVDARAAQPASIPPAEPPHWRVTAAISRSDGEISIDAAMRSATASPSVPVDLVVRCDHGQVSAALVATPGTFEPRSDDRANVWWQLDASRETPDTWRVRSANAIVEPDDATAFVRQLRGADTLHVVADGAFEATFLVDGLEEALDWRCLLASDPG
ncbi:MAG: hypothetical protein IT361_04345 [Gemmatimonadaceae bacterium]|nr:hypothetical protein [Gemmatimonadaceae bacterium]